MPIFASCPGRGSLPSGRHNGTHHVASVRQARWDEVEPHPTDMPILNDAGAGAYPRGLIEDRMAREGICMANVLTGEAFGPVVAAAATRA
jgi:hypothetical protein